MAPLYKSDNKKKFFLSIILSIFLVKCGTTSQKQFSNNQYKEIIFGDSIVKSGYIIYDNENIVAKFIELKDISIENLTEKKILSLYNESEYIILLREGLKYSTKSHLISLTMCDLDKKIIINKEKLLFRRYSVVKIDDFLFFNVTNKFGDSKKRLVFCKND